MTHYLRITITFFITLLYSYQSFACVGGKGFFPRNNWRIPVEHKALNGITEIQFNDIIDKIANIYNPIFQSKGAQLSVQRLWSDATVNAYATRQGNEWIVQMYGGLARHGEITTDGFALVLCHEIGHHLGGVPRYPGTNGWASNEGQSDYFAATKCLRKAWSTDDNQQIVSEMGIPSTLKSQCSSEWGNAEDQALCMRIGMAGLSTTRMFAVLSAGRMPAFDSPDNTQVNQTLDSHPPYQCRLDTYFQGGLCTVNYDEEIGQSNPNIGTCNRANNQETGSRRLCWYRPSTNGGGNPPPPPTGDISPTPTANGQTRISSNNPNLPVPLSIDLSGVSGATSVVLEASKPDTSFSNPNGTAPDPVNSLGYVIINGTKGVYNLMPARQLPNWGTYEFRVLALDRNRKVLSKFSAPFTLDLRP
ncbi:MAG: hypothetical protein K9K67_14795 [Bacteriovoracaceae bacterium]|nr:hypothetical protein [Bacteriovoracaceae bacterium]